MRARKFAGPVGAALVVTVLDQWTKAWIVRNFGLYEAKAVLVDHFHIVHVRNRGVAFSLLANLDHTWVNPALIVATVCAMAAVLTYIHYLPSKGPAPCGLGLVLGGAIGNLIDRARLGYVVDFLDVHWRHHHWPAFNVADIAITAGIVLLILDMLFWGKEAERAARPR